MILIGQYDSPFVRRVAIALHTYGFAYEHWPWSTFADADKLAAYNPLRRVPTLVIGDDEVLIESSAILDFLDERADRAAVLMARGGAERRTALWVCALATGLCDKMVSLVYEGALHQTVSDDWVSRCRTQIAAVMDRLEADRAARPTAYWLGARLGHADIAVACAWRFLQEAHPALYDSGRWPALDGHARRCEDLPAFKLVVQAFLPPGSQ